MAAIIGISANILRDQGGMFPGYERCYVNQDYIHTVVKHGAVPLVLPIHQDDAITDAQVELLDGLILSGGYDITPHLYGEEPQNLLGETLYIRDQFEFKLLEKAKQRGIPILGICRGAQLINVFHGGTLYQDVSYRTAHTLRHWQSHNPTEKTHTVKIVEGSYLAQAFGRTDLLVNSFHHQLIKEVAPNFKIAAQALDGVVECIESADYDYLVGLQWHPEMLWRENVMDALLVQFIKKCESK